MWDGAGQGREQQQTEPPAEVVAEGRRGRLTLSMTEDPTDCSNADCIATYGRPIVLEGRERVSSRRWGWTGSESQGLLWRCPVGHPLIGQQASVWRASCELDAGSI